MNVNKIINVFINNLTVSYKHQQMVNNAFINTLIDNLRLLRLKWGHLSTNINKTFINN